MRQQDRTEPQAEECAALLESVQDNDEREVGVLEMECARVSVLDQEYRARC